MPTTTTATDICNDALSYLGQDGNIVDIGTPATPAARVMARLYPRARNIVLEARNWEFATIRSDQLVEVMGGSTLPMWTYAFTPPDDLIRPISVLPLEAASDNDGQPFLFENGVIYCNCEEVVLRYVYLNEDTTTWTQLFCDAVARRLAALACGTLVRGSDPRLAQVLDSNAEVALSMAGELDGNHTQPEDTYVPAWIGART